MLRRSKGSVTVVLTLVVVLGLAIWTTMGSSSSHAAAIRMAPEPLREMYLNAVFKEPRRHCVGCRTRILGALTALEEDAQKGGTGFSFDYALLIPIIIDNDHDMSRGFSEPIPQIACNAILLRNDPVVIEKMFDTYREERQILEGCALGGLARLKTSWPSFHRAVKATILSKSETAYLIDEARPELRNLL